MNSVILIIWGTFQITGEIKCQSDTTIDVVSIAYMYYIALYYIATASGFIRYRLYIGGSELNWPYTCYLYSHIIAFTHSLY